MAIMAQMDLVHLDCPEWAADYLKAHFRPEQAIWFDMETSGVKTGMLNAFARVFEHCDQFEELGLAFYENQSLNLNTFNKFVDGLSKQKRLRTLVLNLRWCDQVTDEWMENLCKSL